MSGQNTNFEDPSQSQAEGGRSRGRSKILVVVLSVFVLSCVQILFYGMSTPMDMGLKDRLRNSVREQLTAAARNTLQPASKEAQTPLISELGSVTQPMVAVQSSDSGKDASSDGNSGTDPLSDSPPDPAIETDLDTGSSISGPTSEVTISLPPSVPDGACARPPEVDDLHGYCPPYSQSFAKEYGNQIIEECVTGPPENPSATVVMVHVGPDITHGRHSFYALAQLRRTNPFVRIAWILSQQVKQMEEVQAHAECYGVEIYEVEVLEKLPEIRDELARFRQNFFVSGDMGVTGNAKDFNYRTSARMLYVLAFMKNYQLTNTFHMENDNLVYMDLAKYAEILISCGVNMGAGQRNHLEIALGFCFFQTYEPLQKLVEFWIKSFGKGKQALMRDIKDKLKEANYEWINDMTLSQLYRHYHKADHERLTVLPAHYQNDDAKTKCIYNNTEFVLDCGNIAIWHMGDFQDSVPHLNEHGWKAYKQFNPKPWKLMWCRQDHCSSPLLETKQGSKLRVGHLHMHSKRLPTHMSACTLPAVSWSDLFTNKYVDNLFNNLRIRNNMYGQINLMQRLGAPGRHRDGPYWDQGGRDRRPSYPFISGDGFKAMCTWYCGHYAGEGMGPCNIKPRHVLNGDCVFIEMTNFKTLFGDSSYLTQFFNDVLPKLNKKIVVITHNGDMSAPDSDIFWRKKEKQVWTNYKMSKTFDNPNLLHMFSSNCYWDGWPGTPKPDKLTCIPIGIENRYREVGKRPARYIDAMRNKVAAIGVEPAHLVMFGHSKERGAMNPERGHMNALKSMKFVTQAQKMGWGEWQKKIKNFKFVICPWGHGLDTHRTWEVLMMGAFPVVRSSAMDSAFDGLPVLIVKDWKDLTEKMLNDAYARFTSCDSDIHMERLFSSYWSNRVLSYQQLGGW